MSATDTAKEVIRIATTAGLAKDVIDLMEKKLALLAGELEDATKKIAMLEPHVSQLETENRQLKEKLAAAPPTPQIGEGELSVIRILASAGEEVGEKELVAFLKKPITEVKYYLDSLDTLGLARRGSYVPNWGNMWRLTDDGNRFAVKRNLIGNPPPGFPRPHRGPFRA